MKKMIKKIKYIINVWNWFVFYNLVNGESKKVWHLFKVMIKHYIYKTPYAVIIETSNTCNFRCPTCPTPHKLIYGRRDKQFMSFDDFKKIIDNVKDDAHIVYIYNSNEPLLHPQIVEMAKYASDNNLHAMISTNCSMLTEEKTEALLNSGLGEIRFALDGLKKESFEAFREGGNFEEVKKNIEYFCKRKKELKKKRPIATLQFILNKLNQDEILDIKKFAQENAIDKLYIKPFILSEYAYNKDEIKSLSEKFYPDKNIYDEAVVYEKDGDELKPKEDYKFCPSVNNVFTILADGRAVMCCFDLFGDYTYADMREVGLKEMWNSVSVKKMRNLAYNKKLPLCKVCGNIE